jgi:hypothetical protein
MQNEENINKYRTECGRNVFDCVTPCYTCFTNLKLLAYKIKK